MSSSQTLTQQASRGAFWALSSNIAVSVISFLGTAILARMLSPKDFGLIGMAVLVTGIVQLFGNFGLGASLVQKKDVTEDDLSTVFWANMAAGVVLTIVCVLLAPLAAVFFREKAVMWVLISLASTFILSALCSVHNTLIYKRLQMKPLAAIEVSGRLIRIVIMLAAAFCGLKFWSIVIGMIVERVYKTAAFFFLESWRPSRFFSMERFKEMFRFGRNLLGGGLLGYLNQNMDFLVTGRVLGANLLGFYQMSYNLPNLLRGYINDSVGSMAFPVFAKVQDDNVRITRGLLRIIKFISVGTFPILFGLSFTAHDFILVAYSEKWLPAVAPMQILCFGAALASANTAVGALLNAKGRPDLGLKWGLARLPATVLAIFLGVHFGGIVGVAWGMLFTEILSLGIVYQTFRILNSDFREYWKALWPATAACGVTLASLVIANQIPPIQGVSPWIRLGIEFMVGAAVYTGVIIFGFNDTLRDFKGFLQSLVRTT